MEKEKSKKISLVDGHAHLEELSDLTESLQEASAAGVCGIIAVGMDIESNRKVLKIAREDEGYIYPALGYHPWEIREGDVEANLSFIRDHAEECVALGEIGLDYKIKVKKELQWRVFGELLNTALESDRPVIVHSRFSHRRAFEMVRERKIKRAVFHWYSGPVDLLDKILAMGYFISATPALAYSPPHREAIQRAPIERILLETDTPVSYQGRGSRPKDVRMSLEEVARLKGLEPSLVAMQTTANASEFFQIRFLED
ncbi:MAG TPA: TatD family hydrolase [Thermodesulfobacteriota bacterium]|nr:TatD family hydrolase [Thermodesulfobacteriota bacterium]